MTRSSSSFCSKAASVRWPARFSRALNSSPWRLAGRTIPINIPLLIISLVGFSTAIAAPFIATRLYRYHDTLVARARVIESQYDMAQISQLGDVWSEAGNYRSATTIALMTFAAIALPWLLGIIVSVYPS